MAFVDGVRDGEHVGWQQEIEMPIYGPTPFGRTLKRHRLENEISIKTAAELSGFSIEQLSGIEQGKYLVNADQARALAVSLNANSVSWAVIANASAGDEESAR